MTDTSPHTGSIFFDYIVNPIRENRINSWYYSLIRDQTYRRPHNVEYGAVKNWWNKFVMGDQHTLTEAHSFIDAFIPFSRLQRSQSVLAEAHYLDPVWGGVKAHGIDHNQYDFALSHIAENGKYWKVFLHSEKLWSRLMPTQDQIDVDNSPVGLKKETPFVDHETDIYYPWRDPSVRRWPPAHGHH